MYAPTPMEIVTAQHPYSAWSPPSRRHQWFGCNHPERPPDDDSVWAWCCDPCTIHQMAMANRWPDRLVRVYSGDTRPDTTLGSAWAVDVMDLCHQWRRQHLCKPLDHVYAMRRDLQTGLRP